MNPPERFIELDIWRGFAIIGMVAFHFVFLLDFLGYREVAYSHGWWDILGTLVRFSFLLLVGIGMQISYQRSVLHQIEKKQYIHRQLKRAAIVFLCGMLVTVFTAYFIPGDYVRFGVLHLIGTSILFLCFVAHRPTIAAILGVVIYFASFQIQSIVVTNPLLLIFGFSYPFSSVDYFPLFPWLAVPSFGIFLGSVLYKNYQRRWNARMNGCGVLEPVAILGKNSLLIYLMHVPIIIAILWIAGKLLLVE